MPGTHPALFRFGMKRNLRPTLWPFYMSTPAVRPDHMPPAGFSHIALSKAKPRSAITAPGNTTAWHRTWAGKLICLCHMALPGGFACRRQGHCRAPARQALQWHDTDFPVWFGANLSTSLQRKQAKNGKQNPHDPPFPFTLALRAPAARIGPARSLSALGRAQQVGLARRAWNMSLESGFPVRNYATCENIQRERAAPR